jgi:hypothetical protein
VATLEERVAYLEGRVQEQFNGIDSLHDAVVHLERRIDGRFEAIDRRFEGVDRRLDGLDDKISYQFVWLVGIQVTTLAAIVGGLIAR